MDICIQNGLSPGCRRPPFHGGWHGGLREVEPRVYIYIIIYIYTYMCVYMIHVYCQFYIHIFCSDMSNRGGFACTAPFLQVVFWQWWGGCKSSHGGISSMYVRTHIYVQMDIYIYMYIYYIMCMIIIFTYVVSYMYTYLRHYLFVPIIIQMRRTDARLGRTDAHNQKYI